jgi:hypothetical protein
MLQHPAALCTSGFTFHSSRLLMSSTLLLFTVPHIWPSSGVRVVALKESAVLLSSRCCYVCEGYRRSVPKIILSITLYIYKTSDNLHRKLSWENQHCACSDALVGTCLLLGGAHGGRPHLSSRLSSPLDIQASR